MALTPEELAEVLGNSPAAIRRLANGGFLPAVRMTHQILRFDLDKVLAATSELQSKIVSSK